MPIEKQEIEGYKKKIKSLELKISKMEYLKETLFDIFNNSPNAVFILNWQNCRIIDFNSKAKSIFRRNEDELIGEHISILHKNLMHEKLQFDFKNFKQALLSGIATEKIESIAINNQNKEIIVEIQPFPMNYKGNRAFAVIYTDITHRKSVEQQAEISKHRMEMIIDNISDIISIHDFEGKFLFLTNSIRYSSGWSPSQWLGRPGYEMAHPEDVSMLLNSTDRLLSGEKETILQWRCQTIYGEYIWFESVTKIVYDNFFKQDVFLVASRNITSQKNADLKIAESEIKYRSLFDNASDAIFLMDFSVFIDCNTKTLEIFNCTREQIIGNYPYSFSPEFQPDGSRSFDKVIFYINKVMNQGAQQFEWTHKKYSGEEFIAEVSLNKIVLNNRIYIQAIVRDISDKKRNAIAIIEHEKQYRDLVESSPVPILIHSDRVIKYANQATLNTLEAHEPNDIIGQNIANFIHPKSKEIIEQRIKLIYYSKQKQNILIESLISVQGNEKICEISAIPFKFEGKDSSLVLFWDISKDIEMQESLQQSEMLMRNALDGVEDGIWEYDLDTQSLYLSDNALSILGYESDEIGDNLEDWIKLIKYEDFLMLRDELFAKVKCENTHFSYELEITTKIGKKKWIIFRGKYFEFKTVETKRKFIGLLSDISHIKYQEQILALNKIELEKALQTRDNFLSLIAHDLRSPVAGFKSLTKLMVDELKASDSEDMQEIAHSLYNSSENILNLLENLLKWTRITKESMKVNLEPINIYKETEKIIELLKYFASTKKVELINQLPKDIEINADKEMLATILRNIISNAIKFSHRGGKVEIATKIHHALVLITITDYGLGIHASKLAKIFNIDSYESSCGTEGEQGSGLGLIICKELIGKMNGKIEIKSEIELGTQVQLTFMKNNLKIFA